ncbi:hypothetical protein J2X68_006869 [Streptomyces sp. 3330]|nr:hypothetical protein [Streptomyces sp. 3330]
MPLRLARYGVPLAETAPAGLAAAGIDEPPIIFTVEQVPPPVVAQHEGSTLETALEHEPDIAAPPSIELRPRQSAAAVRARPTELRVADDDAERFGEAYQAFITQFQTEPTLTQWALWLRDVYGISTGAGEPLSERQLQPLLRVLQIRHALPVVEGARVAGPQANDQSWDDYFYSAWSSFAEERGTYPDAASLAAYVYERDTITGDAGHPITGEDLAGFVAAFQEREFGEIKIPSEGVADPVGQEANEPLPKTGSLPTASAGAAAQAAKEPHGPRVNAPVDEPLQASPGGGLTTPDRYYLAWMEYQERKGSEPSDKELSAYCADKGLLGRGNKPISPANLRRHFLRWRVYNVWAEQRARTEAPVYSDLAQACADRGITGQHNKPITPDFITEEAVDFERRWQVLMRHRVDAQR